jgi:chloramphenicol O-acetyltransferase type A
MYKVVDVKSWNRYQQYQFFKNYDNPFFNVCSELDVSQLLQQCKTANHSFFIAVLYASMITTNNIKEFRYRLKDQGVIEFDQIYVGSTILKEDDSFAFCYFDYQNKFSQFNKEAQVNINKIKSAVDDFAPREQELGLVHYSTIPWISFSSFSHARNFKNDDSIPKIVFGKYYETNGRVKMPVSVEVHHALMDGLHVGKYYSNLQKMLDNPQFLHF